MVILAAKFIVKTPQSLQAERNLREQNVQIGILWALRQDKWKG